MKFLVLSCLLLAAAASPHQKRGLLHLADGGHSFGGHDSFEGGIGHEELSLSHEPLSIGHGHEYISFGEGHGHDSHHGIGYSHSSVITYDHGHPNIHSNHVIHH